MIDVSEVRRPSVLRYAAHLVEMVEVGLRLLLVLVMMLVSPVALLLASILGAW